MSTGWVGSILAVSRCVLIGCADRVSSEGRLNVFGHLCVLRGCANKVC